MGRSKNRSLMGVRVYPTARQEARVRTRPVAGRGQRDGSYSAAAQSPCVTFRPRGRGGCLCLFVSIPFGRSPC